MNRVITLLVAAWMPLALHAAGSTIPLLPANVDVGDNASLQRGAQLFINYCLSCHSANYMRYNRMGRDLGLTDKEVEGNLMLASDKIGETMSIAMAPNDAKAWFGNPPPDLSVIARSRGADWLYNYFVTFYIDEKRPFGVNNLVFPDVGMPHVLWELEGFKKANFEMENGHRVFKGFEQVREGSMTAGEYDQAARDLTNFLVYMGEPIQLERQRIGVWVLLFLAVLFVLSYLLKKEYWRDIH
ncbi:cytochrome c1 [Ectothiorhodospiraceae bacterium BW-2]|nr:cytochrome c1 [Ectothiorhodospiraceae bacterium BW-2]